MKTLLALTFLGITSAGQISAAPAGAAATARAYVVIEITVTDPIAYEDYKAAIAPVIANHGGRYLARAGKTEAVEGNPPGRIVLLEFASFGHAMKFERSAEALQAGEIRHRSAKSRIYVVEGVTP